MKPSLQKLQKFFRLEAERGFDNRAVLGGLDRILDSWEVDARADSLPEEIIQLVDSRLRDYPRLSEGSRAEALNGLWKRLQELDNGLTPFSPPASDAVKATQEPEERRREKPEAQVEEPLEANGNRATVPTEDERIATSTTPEPQEEPAALDASVTVLPSVGPKHAQTLGHLGLYTLRDMLYYFPRRYDDYSQLKPINRLWYGEVVTVIGSVQSVNTRQAHGGQFQVVEALVSDGTGALRATWFNQPWVAKRLHHGMQVALSGKIDQYLGRLVINNPELEQLEQQQLSTNRIVPVYPLTAQITQRWIRRLMNQVVTQWAPRVRDPLPESLRRSAGVVELSTALLQIHFPDSAERLKAARHRLAFDEIFLLQLGVLRQKRNWQERTGRIFSTPDEWMASQIERLPFPLTNAQLRSIQDISADLQSGKPMNRLLQGDVGSGKTIVAAMAIAMVTQHGAQAAIMAPTGILAEQHYQNLRRLLASGGEDTSQDSSPLKVEEIRLMVGATPETDKREIREGLANGAIKLVVGTHALIEDPVVFADLELTIVDEQHRFGVEQRAALRSKGTNPHLLVMTATPIPRSLALTVYGDLDLSVIDEMPPGRQPVSTYVITPLEQERAYRLIRSQVESGRQAFIIYPLVEESEKSESKAAVEEYTRLQSEVFPRLNLGLLHGRMRPEEKDEVMERFRSGEIHILVSTSVVEVGVDVPNATVMLIEGANRFGLAQLHQFRGRVGRGGDQAFCLLIPDTSDAVENERLQVMAQTNDGFVLAEKDLEQRGPGEFIGTRQSGYAEQIKLASLMDVLLIEKARRHAQGLFELDPNLENPEHQPLAAALERFWGDRKSDIS
jgi:ATP-dependent DNA helicase RecG